MDHGHGGGHGFAHDGHAHGDHGVYAAGHTAHEAHGTLHWHGAPYGDLIGGLAAGHEYVLGHHNGVHVVHRGHFGGGRYGHEPFADDLALAIAIDLAVGHGAHLEPLHTGYLSEHPLFAGTNGGQHNTDQAQRTFNMPGIGRDRYAIEVLVWPHSDCDPQEEIRKLAMRQGMVRIHPRLDNADVDRWEPTTLLSNTPFGDDDDELNRPNGWHRKAHGGTHVWREYFQLQPCIKSGPLKQWIGNPNWSDWRTYLVVSGVTWYFRDPQFGKQHTSRKLENDRTYYETRISFSVWSKGEVINRQWTWRWDEIYAHRDKAEDIAAGTLAYLKRHPSSRHVADYIARIPAEDFVPQVKQPVPALAGNPALATFMPVDAAVLPGTDQFDEQKVEKPAW